MASAEGKGWAGQSSEYVLKSFVIFFKSHIYIPTYNVQYNTYILGHVFNLFLFLVSGLQRGGRGIGQVTYLYFYRSGDTIYQ